MRRPSIFPAGWVEHHRPVAAAAMTEATCQVRKPDRKVTDDLGRTTTQPGEIVIPESDCRVQRTDRGVRDDTAISQVQTNAYMVGLPYTATPIRPKYQVEVLTSSDDRLTGRTFTVSTELTGSQVWERDLWVVDNESD